MKKILLLISLLWITAAAFAQSDCDRFRTGKFVNIENGIERAAIERNDSIQTEKYGPIAIKLKIKWIDECSYRLTFLEGNDAWWNAMGKDHSTPDLVVRITDIVEDGYLQEAKFVDDEEFKYKSNIEKIQ